MSVLKVRDPFSCSGGMYLRVPAWAALVALVLSNLVDIPKSTNFTFS
jgi:hypothetical protein